ncbi:MAG TPA: VTT domain-containing protein [Bryobacteraceae bacterium]|nr:VTT domain-containing protein [Bryobacteraceae bacterium]
MKRVLDTLVAWGPWGIFLVAILDSAGVPSPGGMDLLLLLVTIANPAKAWLSASLAVAGSLIGCMILFYLARRGGDRFLERYTSSGRGARFKAWFLRYGLITVFIPALLVIPMPLKVFVICSGAMGIRPLPFAVIIIAARVPRYFALAYLGSRLGMSSVPWLKEHVWQMLAGAAVLFLLLYVLVRIWERRQPTHPK